MSSRQQRPTTSNLELNDGEHSRVKSRNDFKGTKVTARFLGSVASAVKKDDQNEEKLLERDQGTSNRSVLARRINEHGFDDQANIQRSGILKTSRGSFNDRSSRPSHACTLQIPDCSNSCTSHNFKEDVAELPCGHPSRPVTSRSHFTIPQDIKSRSSAGKTRVRSEMALGATGVVPTHWTHNTTLGVTGTTSSNTNRVSKPANVNTWASGMTRGGLMAIEEETFNDRSRRISGANVTRKPQDHVCTNERVPRKDLCVSHAMLRAARTGTDGRQRVCKCSLKQAGKFRDF